MITLDAALWSSGLTRQWLRAGLKHSVLLLVGFVLHSRELESSLWSQGLSLSSSEAPYIANWLANSTSWVFFFTVLYTSETLRYGNLTRCNTWTKREVKMAG